VHPAQYQRFSTRTALLSKEDGAAGTGHPTPPGGEMRVYEIPQSSPRYDLRSITGFSIAASALPSRRLSAASPTDPDSPQPTELTDPNRATPGETQALPDTVRSVPMINIGQGTTGFQCRRCFEPGKPGGRQNGGLQASPLVRGLRTTLVSGVLLCIEAGAHAGRVARPDLPSPRLAASGRAQSHRVCRRADHALRCPDPEAHSPARRRSTG
jgi:hypothetical protein